MADQGWLYTAAAAIGGAVATGAGVLWRAVDKRSDRESAAKDKTIAVLEAENARLRTERDGSLEREAAALRQLEQERLKTLGVALRLRQDSSIDEAEFEESMPTAVRYMTELVAPKPSLPPGVKEELQEYENDMRSTPPGAYRPKLPSRRG